MGRGDRSKAHEACGVCWVMAPGVLVQVMKLPRYLVDTGLLGKLGIVIAAGRSPDRWLVMVEGRRISFHRNHLAELQK